MNKKNNNKGFTLAELLIVVAIIAVLVAIAIPVFTSQLEKSREATDMANIRSAYAEVVAQNLDTGAGYKKTVALKQTQTGWTSTGEIAGIAVASIKANDGASVGQNKSVDIEINSVGSATIGSAAVTMTGVTSTGN